MKSVSRTLLIPLGPIFPLSIGAFSIVWGLWLLIPKPENILEVYFFIEIPWIHYLTAAATIIFGIFLLYAYFKEKAVKVLCTPLLWLGIVYTYVAVTVGIAEWTNNTWLLYTFLAVYCLFGAANLLIGEEFYRIKLHK